MADADTDEPKRPKPSKAHVAGQRLEKQQREKHQQPDKDNDIVAMIFELKPAYGEITKNEITNKWANLLRHKGLDHTAERLCSFYGNLSIISALMATFCVTMILDPPEEAESGSLLQSAIAAAGVLAFASYTGSVMDCILIDNTAKQIATPAAFVHFLWCQKSFLALPTKLFIVATAAAFAQLVLVIHAKYSVYVVVIALVALSSLGLALLRRFMLLGEMLQATVDGTGSDDGFDEKNFEHLL